MKIVLWFLSLVVVLLSGITVGVQAQVPLTPWYVATSTCNPLTAGCPLQVGPMPTPGWVPPPPTWTPLPPVVLPTATPVGLVRVRVISYTPLWKVPAREYFIPFTLVHIGDEFTALTTTPYWLYLTDGWAAGFWIEAWAAQRL